MSTKLITTIKQITTAVSNPVNSALINDFYQYMKANGASERHQNNNLKAIIALAKFIGPDIRFYHLKRREDIITFLNTKMKNQEQDPDKNGSLPGTIIWFTLSIFLDGYIITRVLKKPILVRLLTINFCCHRIGKHLNLLKSRKRRLKD